MDKYMADKTYNGWKNYETWVVKLWLDNDEGTYKEMNKIAKKAIDVYKLSEEIKDYLEEIQPELGASVWTDLLHSAFSEVDFDEIAQAYMDDNENE
jgi:uncharacterized protein (DUF2384 family)